MRQKISFSVPCDSLPAGTLLVLGEFGPGNFEVRMQTTGVAATPGVIKLTEDYVQFDGPNTQVVQPNTPVDESGVVLAARNIERVMCARVVTPFHADAGELKVEVVAV